jgi:hypothetical protein
MLENATPNVKLTGVRQRAAAGRWGPLFNLTPRDARLAEQEQVHAPAAAAVDIIGLHDKTDDILQLSRTPRPKLTS